MCSVLMTRFGLVAGRRRPLICDRSDKVRSPRHDRGPSPQARGVRARSSALRGSDMARPMQAGRVTPKSPSWVNEVLTKPPSSRGDNTARPGSFTCAQEIVQTEGNSNNNKKCCIINNLCKVSNKGNMACAPNTR